MTKLINQGAGTGCITRLVKVRAHRGEPLNPEAADALASAAAESDPANPVAIELDDPEAVHIMWNEKWVEWDTRLRENLVQRAGGLYLSRILVQKRGRAGAEPQRRRPRPPQFQSRLLGCSGLIRA